MWNRAEMQTSYWRASRREWGQHVRLVPLGMLCLLGEDRSIQDVCMGCSCKGILLVCIGRVIFFP